MDRYGNSSFLRTSSAAVAVATVTVLPLFLVGALGVQLSADLGISVGSLGAASAAFFGTAALVSPFAGAAAARFGVHATMRLSILVAGATLVAIGIGVHSLAMLLIMLGLAGAGNAFSQVSVNLYLAQRTSPYQRGTAYGIKQSAIPAAGLLAGLAVPLLGLTVGWRWAFALFAIPLAALAIFTPGARACVLVDTAEIASGSVPRRILRLIALGSGLAAASASCLPIFVVSGAVAAGWDEVQAGIIFASASGVGIIARLLWGRHADRRGEKHLKTVAMMLVGGAIGFLALATGNLMFYPIGAAVAFGLGWGWPGLIIHAVVQLSPAQPAVGTALLQVGTSVGCVAGPLAFGILLEQFSYAAAWGTAGVTLLFAAAILLAAHEQELKKYAERAVDCNCP